MHETYVRIHNLCCFVQKMLVSSRMDWCWLTWQLQAETRRKDEMNKIKHVSSGFLSLSHSLFIFSLQIVLTDTVGATSSQIHSLFFAWKRNTKLSLAWQFYLVRYQYLPWFVLIQK